MSSSIFVCPYSGIYWFSVSCVGKAGFACAPGIYVESKMSLQTAGALEENYGNQASTSAVVMCEAGQRAWIKNTNDNRLYNGNDGYNSFSGFLLFKY